MVRNENYGFRLLLLLHSLSAIRLLLKALMLRDQMMSVIDNMTV